MTFAPEAVRETQHVGAVVTAGRDRAARRQVLQTPGGMGELAMRPVLGATFCTRTNGAWAGAGAGANTGGRVGAKAWLVPPGTIGRV
jgi:hypothetical protein